MTDSAQKPTESFVKCPTCAKKVGDTTETFPFCSPRCRLVDLGQWLDGGYRLPRAIEQEDEEQFD